jgi:hypothetical protein
MHVDTLGSQLDTMEASAGVHEGKSGSLDARLTSIETDGTNLSDRIGVYETNWSIFQDSMTTMDVRVTNLEGVNIN